MNIKLNKYVLARDYCIVDEEGLDRGDIISYLSCVFRLAKLDGLTKKEENFFYYLTTYLDIPTEVVEEAKINANSQEVDTEDLLKVIEDKWLCKCLYRDCYRMALMDSLVSKDEIEILDDIREHIGLTKEQAKEIQRIVDEEEDLFEEFSQILKN